MKIGIDTSDLMAYSKQLERAEKTTTPTIAVSLNQVGDGLVHVLATNLSKETGLALEQVRGLMQVKRATRNDLNYDVTVNNRLLEDDPTTLEGRRESTDFGTRDRARLSSSSRE